MKFKYKKILPGLIRPIIPVLLQYKQNNPISYEALVDSGADMCVFPAEIGELMGINIRTGHKGSLSGVIGKSGVVYYHSIEIEIGGNKTTISAGFSENQPGGLIRFKRSLLCNADL